MWGRLSLSPDLKGFRDPGTWTGHTHAGALLSQRRRVVPGGNVAKPAWLQLGRSYGTRDALSRTPALPGNCVCAQGSLKPLPWK